MTASSFKQTLRYISHFGLGPGLQAARVHGHPGNVVAIQLPQLAHPVHVRAGTSDADEVRPIREVEGYLQ